MQDTKKGIYPKGKQNRALHDNKTGDVESSRATS